jgi:hypothetical protein
MVLSQAPEEPEEYERLDLVTALTVASHFRRLTWVSLNTPVSNGSIALYRGTSFSTDVTLMVAGELSAVAAVTASQAGAALFTSNPGFISEPGHMPWIEHRVKNIRWFRDGTLFSGFPALVRAIQIGDYYEDSVGEEASAFRLRIALLVKHALESR